MSKLSKKKSPSIVLGQVSADVEYTDPDDTKTLEELFQRRAAFSRERIASQEAAFYALPEAVRKMTQGEANSAGIHSHGPGPY